MTVFARGTKRVRRTLGVLGLLILLQGFAEPAHAQEEDWRGCTLCGCIAFDHVLVCNFGIYSPICWMHPFSSCDFVVPIVG